MSTTNSIETVYYLSIVLVYVHGSIIRPVPYYPDELTKRISSNLTDEQLKESFCPSDSNMGPESNYMVRYYNKTKQCYTIGTKGPCQNNLIFHSELNTTVFGQCDCANFMNSRTLIYHPQTNQCYLIFQQAYCTTRNWLTINRVNGKPICEINPCYYSMIQSSNSNRRQPQQKGTSTITTPEEYVLINNRCVKLNSKCDENIVQGKIITFTKGKILPHCTFGTQGLQYALGAPTLTCAPGSLISLSGNCQSSWTW